MTKICKTCGKLFDTKYKTWNFCGKPCAAFVPIQEKFFDKIQKTDEGCWEWQGGKDAAGYGRFYHLGQSILAHRYAYVYWKGPIPANKVPDHLCRNPGCVNPDHLEVVTEAVNILRGIGLSALNARKSVCVRGHALVPGNVKLKRGKKHGRECLICRDMRNKAYRYPDKFPMPPRTHDKYGNPLAESGE